MVGIYGIVHCSIFKEHRLPMGSRRALLMTMYQESWSRMTVACLFMVRLITPALWPYTCSACLPRQALSRPCLKGCESISFVKDAHQGVK